MSWAELCRDLNDNEFIAACKEWLRQSRFFPAPADILATHKKRPVDYSAPGPALPPGYDKPLDRRRNAISAAMFRKSLAGNQEARRFFHLGSNWAQKEPLAHEVLGNQHPDVREAL